MQHLSLVDYALYKKHLVQTMRVHSGPKKSMLRVGSGTVLLVMMAFKTAYKITLFSMAICDMLMQKKKKGNFKRFMPLDFFTFIPPNF